MQGNAGELFGYDVDTKVINMITLRKEVCRFASLTGINMGVKGVFRERWDNYYTYLLNGDNTTTILLRYNSRHLLNTLLPSSRNPRDLTRSIKVFGSGRYCLNEESHGGLNNVFGYQPFQSIIRSYHDVFLIYDNKVEEWFLMRITVP
eukprot:gnl/Chilomastix_caulleri/3483.p1 GENE.gnl/Chilomastix_caulleri/3483~~gnl/Chilomastix_caulleri/3483.p1  ORF type:complete len:148 (-),score=14.88 gnl/Chilomastix_caulleri/3483:42-485(-)